MQEQGMVSFRGAGQGKGSREREDEESERGIVGVG